MCFQGFGGLGTGKSFFNSSTKGVFPTPNLKVLAILRRLASNRAIIESMRGRTLQIILIAVSLMGTGASGFFMWQSAAALSQLPQSPLTTASASEHGEEAGHGAPAAHGAAPAAEGHGEKPAEGHGEAAAASGHGEAPPAGGHGEAATADAHGAARGPASRKDITPLVSLDEIFANVTD